MKKIIILITIIGITLADVSHLTSTTEYYPPIPYQFQYEAGRYPGHVDRTHAEVSDDGITKKGAFSYVDPNQQVRTVEYVANEHGFYPQLSHPPQDTKAVQLATQRHLELYNKIAERNSDPNYALSVSHPKESAAVEYAREKHLTLFDKIAHEHARIGQEQLAQRLAFEATSIRYEEEEQQQQHYQ